MVTAEQMQEWAQGLQARIQERFAREYPEIAEQFRETIKLERDPKYTRIVLADVLSRSAYGFISNETGNLYQSAGWKSPAKGVRGTMLGSDPFAGCCAHGMAYAR